MINALGLYEKYRDSEFTNEVVRAYIGELSDIMKDMTRYKQNNVRGIYATALVEVNQMHNEVMKLFIADGKPAPLMNDAFMIYWRMMSPEIRTLVKA